MADDLQNLDDTQLPPAPAELPLPPLPRPPFWLMAFFVIMVVITWIPLAVIARARVSKSDSPRVQILQDMGVQPKYKEQQSDELFADNRADRPSVAGTVARGQLEDDDSYYRGFSRSIDSSGKPGVTFFNGFPDRVKLTPELLARGQQRFNIYCYPCHGYDGYGHGPVNQRALELQEPKWIPAASLHTDTVWGRPNGHIFNTITNGIRSMPAYATQVPVQDRWAIVAYIRALELSQKAPKTLVPDGTEIKPKFDDIQ